MHKKIIASVLCTLFLCGCTVSVNDPVTTTSDTTFTELPPSTTVAAEPVDAIDDLSVEKITWGPGNITDHKQPVDPVNLQSGYGRLDARWLLDDPHKVCLTFDEGYENGYTPQILDTLKSKGVRAMFFVTYDFVFSEPDLVKRMIDEGHIVGNHTRHHYDMTTVSIDVARDEIKALHDYVSKKFGYEMKYFRFPEGSFSEQNLGIVQDMGYKSVFWSYAYADWDPNAQTDNATALASICDSTHSGEIILLHAVSKTNAEILPDVIDDIRRQGYDFTVEM